MLTSADFLKINFFKKIFQECQAVWNLGSRSGTTFCRSWFGSKLFAKVIKGRQKSLLAREEVRWSNKSPTGDIYSGWGDKLFHWNFSERILQYFTKFSQNFNEISTEQWNFPNFSEIRKSSWWKYLSLTAIAFYVYKISWYVYSIFWFDSLRPINNLSVK